MSRIEYIKDRIRRVWSRPVRPMLLLIPTIIVSMLIVGASTFAWFLSNDGKENKFTGPDHKLRIEAIDIFTPPMNPMPGSTFNKTVGAKNTGDLPGFVRLLVEPTIFYNDASGATPLPAQIGQEVLLPDLDIINWKVGEDGYYYYLGLLQPGEIAPNLFTQVQLANMSVLDERYENATMKIEIKAEGVDYYSYKIGLATHYHFRDAFWEDPTGAPPASQPDLRDIDTIFRGLAN